MMVSKYSIESHGVRRHKAESQPSRKGDRKKQGAGGRKDETPLSVGCCFEMWYIPKEWLTISFRKYSEGFSLMGLRRCLFGDLVLTPIVLLKSAVSDEHRLFGWRRDGCWDRVDCDAGKDLAFTRKFERWKRKDGSKDGKRVQKVGFPMALFVNQSSPCPHLAWMLWL